MPIQEKYLPVMFLFFQSLLENTFLKVSTVSFNCVFVWSDEF